MGQATDDLVNGFVCSYCGIFFQEEHGYPVICEDCWNDLTPAERKDAPQRATIEEL